jgi:FkbM family methyltransferase
MKLSTARKIALARVLYRGVTWARRVAGRAGTEVVCRRRGVRWSLDLSEGVQFGIYTGLYERATSKLLRDLATPGSLVIDVGANIGAHALPLARAVGPPGRVIAIEPTDAAYGRLLRNRQLNPEIADRIVPIQAALGSPAGGLEPAYYAAWELTQTGKRHPVHGGTRQSAAGARFHTLDDLVEARGWAPIALIKIDVDGAELSVLRGAVRLIERDRPTVVFEVCPYLVTDGGDSPATLLEFFTSRGYQLLDERTRRPVGRDTQRLLDRIPQGGGINLVAMALADSDRPA